MLFQLGIHRKVGMHAFGFWSISNGMTDIGEVMKRRVEGCGVATAPCRHGVDGQISTTGQCYFNWASMERWECILLDSGPLVTE
jgi:hypothetical protein